MKKYWPFNQELQALDCMIGTFQIQLKKMYLINNALPIKAKTSKLTLHMMQYEKTRWPAWWQRNYCNSSKWRENINEQKVLFSQYLILFNISNFSSCFEEFHLIHDSFTWMEGKQMYWNISWHYSISLLFILISGIHYDPCLMDSLFLCHFDYISMYFSHWSATPLVFYITIWHQWKKWDEMQTKLYRITK